MYSSLDNVTHNFSLIQSNEEDSLCLALTSQNDLKFFLARILFTCVVLYLFIGIVKLFESILTSIEQIVEKSAQCDRTLANLTIVAFGLNSFEILFPSIELVQSGFQSFQSGPMLILVILKNLSYLNKSLFIIYYF